MFEMALRKDIYEERQNQLRWQVKIGEGQMSHQDRQVVMVDRAEAWEQYKVRGLLHLCMKTMHFILIIKSAADCIDPNSLCALDNKLKIII